MGDSSVVQAVMLEALNNLTHRLPSWVWLYLTFPIYQDTRLKWIAMESEQLVEG